MKKLVAFQGEIGCLPGRMRLNDQTLNRLAVLKAIRHASPVSRTELLKLTGLSAGTITNLTADLLKRGLIVEKREAARRSGRPRTHLEINPERWIVVGASIEFPGIVNIAFVDLLGNRLFARKMQMERRRNLEEYASRMAEALERAIGESPFDSSQISRIGIALPAIIDFGRGTVHFMTTFPPGPVPFAAIIERRLGLPVNIENDSVCMARAEHWFGRAQDIDTFTMLYVGFSIGSAEYVDGLPRHGANGFNSEIAHTKMDFGAEARRCFCGGKGCLTAYASMHGILAHADMLGDAPFPQVTTMAEHFEEFLERAQAGEEKAMEILEMAGFHLGRAVANMLNASDPGTVLILVPNARFQALIAEPFQAVLRANTLPGILPNTRVQFAISNSEWRWKGTAALALEQTYLTGDMPVLSQQSI